MGKLLDQLRKASEKDDALIPTTVRLPPGLKDAVREFAMENHIVIAELYRTCLEEGFKVVKRDVDG